MPFRSPCLPWHIHPPPRPRLRPPCLLQSPLASHFYSSTRYQSDSTPNHYEILHLTPSATPQEIKRQFFTLSKLHHPDKNPDDPTASTRFVQISEAYHVLSVPEKRAQYDHHLHASRHLHHRHGTHSQGSFSSASFAGSRPASGLSKKRGTFRGPPPSFYKGGGYGKHGAKRTEYAHQNTPGGSGQDEGSYGQFGGFGPGQTGQGNEVPHFNDQRHKRTHDQVNEHIYARRRKRASEHIPDELDRSGMLINFLLVSGALGLIAWSAVIFTKDNGSGNQKGKENQES
ncbi:DnaJ-domain-containing protein [Zopfia rhizophila CBS 207.26]|uniref:DnaJ-domain-containing protein n=1 Tax=Zopfia rhizophila CBS 207.26 TaxID=1314779 RepID=A0A6A6DXA6_9PEZI|nr:DnaJ-domain-containing protein [Zopfia rhizophila CBS 207.26]